MWCGRKVWSNESRSFVPPVTHKVRNLPCQEWSHCPSCCLRWLWGGLCWSQQPCLPRFLPKLFRSLRCPSPNARCETCCEHLWCGVCLSFLSCLQPQKKLAFKPHKGTAEMWKSKGWQEMSLGKKSYSHPYLRNPGSALLKVQILQSPLYGTGKTIQFQQHPAWHHN